MSALPVETVKGGVRFSVHVQPRASKTEAAGCHGTSLKVRLQAPPVEGAANDALVEFLASALGVQKRCVRIISGKTSREKIVGVDGVSPASIRALAEGAAKE